MFTAKLISTCLGIGYIQKRCGYSSSFMLLYCLVFFTGTWSSSLDNRCSYNFIVSGWYLECQRGGKGVGKGQ